MHVAQISTDNRPLIYEAVFDLRVARVEVEELEGIGLLALLLNECLRVQNLIQLPIELISVTLQLIRLRSYMLIDIVKGTHQYLINLLSDLCGILSDMLHLCHDLL